MADSTQLELQSSSDCTFVWDPQTHLYFHASSRFYHDPDAGWYYSSRDGLYYTFENGNYVLLDKGNDVDAQNSAVDVADKSATAGLVEDIGTQVSEHPPPPSEWLEDTLIDLYLSGYNVAVNSAAHANTSLEIDDSEKLKFPSDGNDEMYELEEGEWIPEENCLFGDSSGAVPYEGDTWDEENWRAQYGQVTRCEEEPIPEFPVVDLWDWNMVSRPKEDGKNQVARLIGRLVKPSAKVHPSVPSGGGLYKTAPICEVHLDLVRVRTGQVYKLRTPSPRYLASLSTYDSSDPTKDWGFPDLLVNKKASLQFKSRQKHKTEAIGEKGVKDLSILSDQPSTSLKGSHVYRDRAAERRTLHGGFGLGPGQKNTATEHDSDPTCIEDAKAEALNKSFGAGSYARRILEGMGWKEGEALGSSTKGLTEPLQPIGNMGSAGLGWPQTRHR